jgi:hypothetical protein
MWTALWGKRGIAHQKADKTAGMDVDGEDQNFVRF